MGKGSKQVLKTEIWSKYNGPDWLTNKTHFPILKVYNLNRNNLVIDINLYSYSLANKTYDIQTYSKEPISI